MGRLIDLDELLKFPIRIDHYDKEHGNEDFVLGIETVFEYAETLPILEAVAQGYWVVHRNAEVRGGCLIWNYECSECNDWFRKDSEYCPSCGAKMDGERRYRE